MKERTRQRLIRGDLVDRLWKEINRLDFFDRIATDLDTREFELYWNMRHNNKETHSDTTQTA